MTLSGAVPFAKTAESITEEGLLFYSPWTTFFKKALLFFLINSDMKIGIGVQSLPTLEVRVKVTTKVVGLRFYHFDLAQDKPSG